MSLFAVLTGRVNRRVQGFVFVVSDEGFSLFAKCFFFNGVEGKWLRARLLMVEAPSW